MRCPFCGHLEDKVVDSREAKEGDAIRRRRECLSCGRRFTSYERVEEVPILIVKKDGRREPFDRNKLLKGMLAACQKRPVRLALLEELAGDIHSKVAEQPDREIRSMALGEMVMEGLKTIDTVAYVRFASVYREFKDLSDFVKSLESLVNPAKRKGRSVFAKSPEQVPPSKTVPEKAPRHVPISQPPLFGEVDDDATKKGG
ncbi:MAG: transcriptional regulator NrdR [Holophagales bacterium]|nr:transcriptional regulator NrdR [Holophagales bacterium]